LIIDEFEKLKNDMVFECLELELVTLQRGDGMLN
jgi:hypothetical protein